MTAYCVDVADRSERGRGGARSDADDDQVVFRALADPTRRRLLDRLRADSGLTLSVLCAELGMKRQSATQHLDLLVQANLVSVHRQGRERLHYLNPVPIRQLSQRWISRFERPRLEALDEIKRKAEAMTEATTGPAGTEELAPDYVHVTYIRADPQQVWDALTDPEITAKYWGHRNISDWQVGSPWQHVRADGSEAVDVVGEVVASEPPRLLETIWRDPENLEQWDRCRFRIEAGGEVTKLTVTHSHLTPKDYPRTAGGWRVILANLKTLLETGEPLAAQPWDLA